MDKISVCGGCNAKISAGNLDKVLNNINPYRRDDILVGFDGKDDAAIIKISDSEAIIQTLDFFPTMVEDPYIFGQIAATNALSDIYAMGGDVISALNIAMFPQEEDFNILNQILRGGNDKVREAKASLVGGHSIHDPKIKYGLSVTGKVYIDKIWKNNTPKNHDRLLITKKIGNGILCANYNSKYVSSEDYNFCINQMTTLNKYARDIFVKYNIHAATDITGFGLLGHISEMVCDKYMAVLNSKDIPILNPSLKLAKEFLYTSGGQNNRNYLSDKVEFLINDYALEEVLFDPQTSGGLLVSVGCDDAKNIIKEFRANNMQIYDIGEIKLKRSYSIIVK